MFYIFQCNVLSAAQLCFTPPDGAFLFWCQHVLSIHQLLWFNDHRSLHLCDLDKITSLQTQRLKNFFRNNDLTALTNLANWHSCTSRLSDCSVYVHTLRLSDKAFLSSTAVF